MGFFLLMLGTDLIEEEAKRKINLRLEPNFSSFS